MSVEVSDMRDYIKGLGSYTVTVTAGVEHTATTFTETFTARSAEHARQQAEIKWSGAAIGGVSKVLDDTRDRFAAIRRTRACYRCGASPEHCDCPDQYEPDGARG